MISFFGLQKLSLVDYPPYLCTTLFLSGCNFSCFYCHNKDLVNNKVNNGEFSQEKVIEFLKSRTNFIDAICITGGEPTLNNYLIELLKEIKLLNLKIKLDTNGSNPKVLNTIIKQNLVDYIAMDLKTDLKQYHDLVSHQNISDKILNSIQIIQKSKVDHEFRSTIIKNIHSKDILIQMAKTIGFQSKLVLQAYKKSDNEVGGSQITAIPPNTDDLIYLNQAISKYTNSLIR